MKVYTNCNWLKHHQMANWFGIFFSFPNSSKNDFIDTLMQDSSNSNDNALELLHPCTKPSILSLDEGKSEGFDSCDQPSNFA